MSKETFRAWWELLRAGNVFTAASNVIAGFVIVQGTWQPLEPLLLLILASILLYEAGMVLNDVFDTKIDARQRPERPLPSGRIARGTATIVGWGLLVDGILIAGVASYFIGHPLPGLTALALAFCIVGYDGGVKNTPLGPWTMGGCRLLNVMLGASVAAQPWQTAAVWYALFVGIYTAGLTYFARQENEPGWKPGNTLGVSLVVAATLCICVWRGNSLGSLPLAALFFAVLNVFFWVDLGRIGLKGVNVGILRGTVGRVIVGFILLDAIIVYGHSGLGPGLMVLALVVPTWIASRFAPMT